MWTSTTPSSSDVWKTVQILLNKVIYADSYLQTRGQQGGA